MPDNPAPDLKVPDLQVPDAQTLLRQTARILKGTTYAEVWALLLEGLGFFGIKAVRYGLTRSRYGMSLGDLQDILFLSSLGEEDFATYIETGSTAVRRITAGWRRMSARCRWDGLWPRRGQGGCCPTSWPCRTRWSRRASLRDICSAFPPTHPG